MTTLTVSPESLPARIPDDRLHALAEEYRRHCGKNDVLVDRDKRVVNFDYFLMLNLACETMDDAVIAWRMKQERRRSGGRPWKRLSRLLRWC